MMLWISTSEGPNNRVVDFIVAGPFFWKCAPHANCIINTWCAWCKSRFLDRSMEGRKVHWLVSDFMLRLPVLKICWVLVSYQKNIHNFLRRVLKYPSLFQLHICVSPKFLHILQPKLCECRSTYEKLPILGGNIAVFH